MRRVKKVPLLAHYLQQQMNYVSLSFFDALLNCFLKFTFISFLGVINIKDILKALKQGSFSSSKWYPLGIHLGLLPATLKDIEANHRGDVRRCLAECLESWLNKGDHCTWDSLADALETIGENATAKEIRQRSKEIMII